MTRITDDQFSARLAVAQLKIVEAKATLWVSASAFGVLAVCGGVALLIAAFFKLVLG